MTDRFNYTFVNDIDLDQRCKRVIITTFYQVARFPGTDCKYQIKKYLFDEDNYIRKTKVYCRNKKNYVKFFRCVTPNKYKIFPVINIDDIGLPNLAEFLEARSPTF